MNAREILCKGRFPGIDLRFAILAGIVQIEHKAVGLAEGDALRMQAFVQQGLFIEIRELPGGGSSHGKYLGVRVAILIGKTPHLFIRGLRVIQGVLPGGVFRLGHGQVVEAGNEDVDTVVVYCTGIEFHNANGIFHRIGHRDAVAARFGVKDRFLLGEGRGGERREHHQREQKGEGFFHYSDSSCLSLAAESPVFSGSSSSRSSGRKRYCFPQN